MNEVLGDKALQALLKELGPRIERKVTRGAMSDAAKPLVKAARRNAKARKVTGGLAKSAGKRVKTYTKDGVIYVAVGYLWKKGGYHAHLVEFGHRIARGGTLSRIGKTGKKGEGTAAGRVKGYPLLAPAFRQTRHKVQRIIFARHRARIEKEAVKLAAAKGTLKR